MENRGLTLLGFFQSKYTEYVNSMGIVCSDIEYIYFGSLQRIIVLAPV